jgi:2-oxo-4-hydroxy-4-carboxy--5-ureidoimidazoline (OHCU) decarboxylase
LPPISELNRLDDAAFAAEIGQLFEGTPRFVARLAAARPFESYVALIDRAEIIAARLPEDEQLELIDGHPRIGAVPSEISPSSYREQGYDRDHGTAELEARLDRLNDEYERRFGFRFVIFVAGRSRDVIATLMERHLEADPEDERHRALRDVFAIARDRAQRLAPG